MGENESRQCVPAHAWLLAARSPTLASMLRDGVAITHPASEDAHGKPRLRLPRIADTDQGLDSSTLLLLLHYVYCGHIDAPLHTLPTLRRAADVLGLKALVTAIDAELVRANMWQGLDGRAVPACAALDDGPGLRLASRSVGSVLQCFICCMLTPF